MSDAKMTINLRVWRQTGPKEKGYFMDYQARNVSPHMSFLEMLDVMNEDLVRQGKEAV